MDRQATELLAVLRTKDIEENIKLDLLTKLKAYVKHRAVAEEAIEPTFEVIRTTLGDGLATIQESGYSLLSHLARRMMLQGQEELLAGQCMQTLHIVVHCLSDGKDRIQQRAVQALVEIWEIVQGDVEESVRETISNGRSRAKMASLQWLVKMHQTSSEFRFKSFVPVSVQCLKEAASVSAASKSALVKLFDSASDAAKSDLYRELTKQSVAKDIREEILSKIGHRPRSSGSFPRPASVASQRSNRPLSAASNRPQSSFGHSAMRTNSRSRFDTSAERSNSSSRAGHVRSGKDDSIPIHKKTLSASSSHRKENENPLASSVGPEMETRRPKKTAGPVPALNSADALPPPVPAGTKAEQDPSRPLNINTNGTFLLSKHLTNDHKDSTVKLDEQVRDMAPAFEGKEEENNWNRREKNLITMRRITQGNAPRDFPLVYVSMIRGNLEGILKSVNSLRTTVSSHGCALLQESIRAAGSGLDPSIEIMMQTLIKLCGHTKTINAQNGNATITAIFSNVTYKHSLLAHVTNASGDKNVRPRGYAQGWLKTIISRHINHKHVLEHGNGADTMVKIINKGLGDPDPGVRDSARDTYWAFASVWPQRAELIMANLKSAAQNQLLQHSSNPDPSNTNAPLPDQVKPKTLSRTAATSSRPNLKEVMMAKKKEKAQMENHAATKPKETAPQKVPIQPKPASSTGTLSSAPLRPMRSKATLRRADTPSKSAASDPHPRSKQGSPENQPEPPRQPAPASAPAPKEVPQRRATPVETYVASGVDESEEDLTIKAVKAASPPKQASKSPARELEAKAPSPKVAPLLDPIKLELTPKPRPFSPDLGSISSPKETRQHLGELSESRTNTGNLSDPNANAIIDSGIKRIITSTLDAHGYRKLRSTICGNLDAMTEEKTDELISAILPRLGDATSTADDRIVMQQNLLLAILFKSKRKQFGRYIPDVLCNIILAISRYSDQSHVASNLSNFLLEIVQDQDLPATDALNALLDLNRNQNLSLYGHTQCLAGIGSIVTKHLSFDGESNETLLKEVLSEASKAMTDLDASLRRCGNLVAAATFNVVKDERKFWDAFNTIGKADKTMLLYTIRQQGGKQQQPQ